MAGGGSRELHLRPLTGEGGAARPSWLEFEPGHAPDVGHAAPPTARPPSRMRRTSSDPGYDGNAVSIASVRATENDDDLAGVTVSVSELAVPRGRLANVHRRAGRAAERETW